MASTCFAPINQNVETFEELKTIIMHHVTLWQDVAHLQLLELTLLLSMQYGTKKLA